MVIFLLIFFANLFITWVLVKTIIPYLKRFFIDNPNKRSSHFSPKPRAAGISFVIVIVIVAIFLGDFNPLLSFPLALIGFWDDLRGSPKILRYIFQLLTVFLLVYNSNIILILNELFPRNFIFIPTIFLLIFGTAIINFINFMDGIDGIIAGNIILVFISGSLLVANYYLLFASSLIGFLIWNWNPSKVFMGDVGSTFLGALIVGLLFKTKNLSDSFMILIVASPILLDAFICIVRRIIHNQNVFEAHCSHLYQRLVKAGWSHGSVAILYMIFTTSLLITMMLGDVKNMLTVLIIQLFIGFWLDQKVAIPFGDSFKD